MPQVFFRFTDDDSMVALDVNADDRVGDIKALLNVRTALPTPKTQNVHRYFESSPNPLPLRLVLHEIDQLMSICVVLSKF